MSLPLLDYKPKSQNIRVRGFEVPGDDEPRIYSSEYMLSSGAIEELIEAAYRQIFFSAFKSEREPFLESQLKNGQITVRDFIRGLLLSENFKRGFYERNNNYRFVEQCIQRVLGRNPYNEKEKIAWSIKIGTKGLEGFIDELLDSEEYMENFGYDIVPYHRRRVIQGRQQGEIRFDNTTPRYGEYYRAILGFPQIIWQTQVRGFKPQEKQPKAGDPSLYLNMARSLPNRSQNPPRVSAMNISLDSVPYRKK